MITREIYTAAERTRHDVTTPVRFYGHNNLGQSMSRTFIYRAGWNAPAEACVRVCAGPSARLRRFVCALAARRRGWHSSSTRSTLAVVVWLATRRGQTRVRTHTNTPQRGALCLRDISHTIGQEHRACACSIDRCRKITRRWREVTTTSAIPAEERRVWLRCCMRQWYFCISNKLPKHSHMQRIYLLQMCLIAFEQ